MTPTPEKPGKGMTIGSCWIWPKFKDQDGYGRIQLSGKWRLAHRFIYETLRSPIKPGLVSDHLCRVRECVNPWHLEMVTNKENVLRGNGITACNSRKEFCPKGHPYTKENTDMIFDKSEFSFYRRCRECWKVWNKTELSQSLGC